MLAYNLQLAWLSLRQTPGLSALAVLAIAVGLGILMTIQAQSYQMRSLPVGEDTENIYLVQMDNRDIDAQNIEEAAQLPSLSYRDAINLLDSDTPAQQQTIVWKTRGIVNTREQDINPVRAPAVVTTHSFFSMFNTPFLYGSGWSEEAGRRGDAVVVITRRLNNTLFGGEDSVGRQITVINAVATVVGVLDEWTIKSQFYDRSFFRGFSDDIFIPQEFAASMNLPRYTQIQCAPAEMRRMAAFRLGDIQTIMNSECGWINLWAEFDSESSVQDYRDFMFRYVEEQKALGRFPREQNNFLENIIEHQNAALNRDDRFKLYQRLAWFFAGVCLLNTIVILLAKYIRKTKEVALRRALGAKRNTLLGQYLIELMVIGLIGGFLGIAVAYLGLQGMLEVYMYGTDYVFPRSAVNQLYSLDWKLIQNALLIGISSTIIAGLYPIWKVCNIAPAPQLKTE